MSKGERKFAENVFKTNLKQSDNILYACFVWSSLLWLGKRVGTLERLAYRTAWQK